MTARTLIICWMFSLVLIPVLSAIGSLFKVQHWPLPWLFHLTSFVITSMVGLAIGVKVLRYPGFKDFLDS